ncbi:adenylate cyclase [Chromobacterium sinusclupearum]|uniref:Adenylate cyclase n=1 Tax=Chromobacterium sinusclupearum TaxID=2077146 RepID=A0A2K4MR40_9NEIS|nr:adenylate cyclase [Chromobacterium sinusclupearum]
MGHFGKWFGRRHGHHESTHHDRQASAGSPPSLALQGCPSCRQGNAAHARFCQHCGISLQPPPCGQCGQEAGPGARFCAQCGAGLG